MHWMNPMRHLRCGGWTEIVDGEGKPFVVLGLYRERVPLRVILGGKAELENPHIVVEEGDAAFDDMDFQRHDAVQYRV